MTLEKVVHHYFPNSKIIHITRPKGGVSADLTVVELLQANRILKIVIRQIQSAANEFNLLKILQSAGVPSPIPLFLDESCKLMPTPFLILKHIEGEPIYRFDDAQAVTAGAKIGCTCYHPCDSSRTV